VLLQGKGKKEGVGDEGTRGRIVREKATTLDQKEKKTCHKRVESEETAHEKSEGSSTSHRNERRGHARKGGAGKGIVASKRVLKKAWDTRARGKKSPLFRRLLLVESSKRRRRNHQSWEGGDFVKDFGGPG